VYSVCVASCRRVCAPPRPLAYVRATRNRFAETGYELCFYSSPCCHPLPIPTEKVVAKHMGEAGGIPLRVVYV
jgi:hypothetical protein